MGCRAVPALRTGAVFGLRALEWLGKDISSWFYLPRGTSCALTPSKGLHRLGRPCSHQLISIPIRLSPQDSLVNSELLLQGTDEASRVVWGRQCRPPKGHTVAAAHGLSSTDEISFYSEARVMDSVATDKWYNFSINGAPGPTAFGDAAAGQESLTPHPPRRQEPRHLLRSGLCRSSKSRRPAHVLQSGKWQPGSAGSNRQTPPLLLAPSLATPLQLLFCLFPPLVPLSWITARKAGHPCVLSQEA